eukprot:scaffold82447_cov52-Attheya_sp.AAC.2
MSIRKTAADRGSIFSGLIRHQRRAAIVISAAAARLTHSNQSNAQIIQHRVCFDNKTHATPDMKTSFLRLTAMRGDDYGRLY